MNPYTFILDFQFEIITDILIYLIVMVYLTAILSIKQQYIISDMIRSRFNDSTLWSSIFSLIITQLSISGQWYPDFICLIMNLSISTDP